MIRLAILEIEFVTTTQNMFLRLCIPKPVKLGKSTLLWLSRIVPKTFSGPSGLHELQQFNRPFTPILLQFMMASLALE